MMIFLSDKVAAHLRQMISRETVRIDEILNDEEITETDRRKSTQLIIELEELSSKIKNSEANNSQDYNLIEIYCLLIDPSVKELAQSQLQSLWSSFSLDEKNKVYKILEKRRNK